MWSALGILTLGAVPAEAANYTVRTDGSGSFTTIQACANAAKAGDICLVYPGIYSERVRTAAGGTSDTNRIVFKAQGVATMQGFDIRHAYVTVEGFDITGYYVDWTSMITIQPAANYANIINNTIRDNNGVARTGGIKFERVSGASASNAVIRGNTLARLNYTYFLLYGSNHLIENNTLTESRQWDAFYIFGSNHTIRRNVFSNPGTPSGGNHPDYAQTFSSDGGPAEGMLFEENWVQDLPEQFCQMNSSVNGVGALVTNIKAFTFRRNIILNVPANCNIDIPGVVFENNTIYRMAYNSGMTGFILSGSLSRGDSSNATFRNNVLLGGGSSPTTVDDTRGFYAVDGFLFTREVIAMYVTAENFGGCPTNCPLAAGIATEMINNAYIDGNTNGHILAAARALSSIDQMVLSSTYDAYKPALWTKLQESIAYDKNLKATFSAHHNYVAGAASAGYPAKKSSGCNCGAAYTLGNFCEAACRLGGINGGDPQVASLVNFLGPDGIPFTLDDGLKPLPTSPLCGKGEGGIDIGAYSCDPAKVFSGGAAPQPPTGLTVRVK